MGTVNEGPRPCGHNADRDEREEVAEEEEEEGRLNDIRLECANQTGSP